MWELLIVDDASTDDTPMYLEALQASDDRIKVFRNSTSMGGGGARNIALKAASGEFATGLDDDDCFTPNRIEDLMQCWASHEGSGVACVFSPIVPEVNGVLGKARYAPPKVTYAEMFSCNHIGSQVLAPTKHYIESGLFDEAMPAWQDYEFFLRMLTHFGVAYSTQEPTYIYESSPRKDRISKKSEDKLRWACNRLIEVHAANAPIRAQQLLAQLYQPFYGVVPKPAELFDFIRLQPSVWSIKTAARIYIRGWVGK